MLYHRIVGEKSAKDPLYLIHTTPLDGTYFEESLLKINLPFQIVIPDLPGHGQSQDVNEEDLAFNHMAEQIDQLREKLGHEQIYLLGHGVGGFVAQEYAIKFENHLKGLILLNTSPNTKYREMMAWNIREQYSKVTIQALEQYRGQTDDKSLRARFTQSLSTYFYPSDTEAAKELMDHAHRIGTDAYVYISREVIPNIGYRQQLRNLSIPVLVIACTNDVWPDSSAQLFRNDIIHANYAEFDTGHFPMIEAKDKFWQEITKFIETN